MSRSNALRSTLKRGPLSDLFFASVDGRIIALDFDTGLYYALSGADETTWRILLSTGDVRRAAQHLATNYDVTVDKARADLENAIGVVSEKRKSARAHSRASMRHRQQRPHVVRFVSALFRLSVRDFSQIAALVAVASIVEIGLRFVRVDKLATMLGATIGNGEPTATSVSVVSQDDRTLAEQELLKNLDRVMRRWIGGDTCLRRALVAAVFLRPRNPVLYFGTRQTDGEFAAHAWLDANGIVVNDPGDWVPLTSNWGRELV